jgi:serine/threonine protein kinase
MPSKIDNYTVTKTLGSGISAEVKLASSHDGKQVALKIFDKTNPSNTSKALATLKQEVEVYQKLNHPYMINLIDFKEHADWIKSDGTSKPVAYMVLELISGGELFDYVALKAFPESTCRYYF